jgi:hypothetical protein
MSATLARSAWVLLGLFGFVACCCWFNNPRPIIEADEPLDGMMEPQEQHWGARTAIVPNRPHRGPFAVVLIMTTATAQSALARQVIRSTWLTYSKHLAKAKASRGNHGSMRSDAAAATLVPSDRLAQVKNVFVVGDVGLQGLQLAQLRQEQQQHGDIRFLHGFGEDYSLLAKKLLLSIELIASEFEHFEYLIKADEDTYVRLDSLLTELGTNIAKSDVPKLYWGQFFRGISPRQPDTPWDDPTWDLGAEYPPYALGGGYVVAGNLIRAIAANVDMYATFHNEDATLGLWLSPYNVTRKDDWRRFDGMAKNPTMVSLSVLYASACCVSIGWNFGRLSLYEVCCC